jgi:hypothetical protein
MPGDFHRREDARNFPGRGKGKLNPISEVETTENTEDTEGE